MRRAGITFRQLSLVLAGRAREDYFRRTGDSEEDKDAASASKPSWRFRLRRAPAATSSMPAIARMTQGVFTARARASNSFARWGLRIRGVFAPDVRSSKSDNRP